MFHYFCRTSGEDFNTSAFIFTVTSAANNINNNSDPFPVVHYISSITFAPEFNFTTRYNDLALIELSDDINLDGISADIICLAKTDPAVGESLQIIGWGTATEDSVSNYNPALQEAVVLDECDSFCELFVQTPLEYDPETEFCASQNVVGFCNGDTGGPAFINNGTNFIQYGVISHQSGCGTSPGYYTKVGPFRQWIQGIMGQCLSC